MEHFYVFDIENYEVDNIPVTFSTSTEDILANLSNFSINENTHLVFQLQSIPKDDTNLKFKLLVPYFQFEKEFLKSKPFSNFCTEFVGCKLKLEKQSEIDLSTKIEQERNKIFIPYLYLSSTKKLYKVGNIDFDKSDYSKDALKYYKKKNRIHDGMPSIENGFRNSKSNYMDSGYDTDSAFGGESDAYWNID